MESPARISSMHRFVWISSCLLLLSSQMAAAATTAAVTISDAAAAMTSPSSRYQDVSKKAFVSDENETMEPHPSLMLSPPPSWSQMDDETLAVKQQRGSPGVNLSATAAVNQHKDGSSASSVCGGGGGVACGGDGETVESERKIIFSPVERMGSAAAAAAEAQMSEMELLATTTVAGNKSNTDLTSGESFTESVTLAAAVFEDSELEAMYDIRQEYHELQVYGEGGDEENNAVSFPAAAKEAEIQSNYAVAIAILTMLVTLGTVGLIILVRQRRHSSNPYMLEDGVTTTECSTDGVVAIGSDVVDVASS